MIDLEMLLKAQQDFVAQAKEHKDLEFLSDNELQCLGCIHTQFALVISQLPQSWTNIKGAEQAMNNLMAILALLINATTQRVMEGKEIRDMVQDGN